MRRLRAAGVRTALVTNNAAEFAATWRPLLPLGELFDAVVDSSEVGLRKPDPRIFRHALARLGGVAPERAVFLGRTDRGQEAPDVDLRPDYRVSRLHARIVPEQGDWWIEDLGSKHGTRVDGREVRGTERVRLASGAAIE